MDKNEEIMQKLEYLAIKANEGLDRIALELVMTIENGCKAKIYEHYIERRKYHEERYKKGETQ